MIDEWQPISEQVIWDKINDARLSMAAGRRQLWEAVKIIPEKWASQRPHYEHGVWVVAIIGRTLIWYDDTEEGFVISLWTKYGIVDGDYSNGERSLEDQLQIISCYFSLSSGGSPAEFFR